MATWDSDRPHVTRTGGVGLGQPACHSDRGLLGENGCVIDHLVLATPDVTSTAAQVGDEWGVATIPGGSHTGRGTRNELTGLGAGVYLEIVGPDAKQPDPPFPRPFGVDDLAAPALVAWCARPARPLADVIGRVRAHGIDLGSIAEMERMRPDGVQLRWLLTFPLTDEPHRGTLPFLIDWLESPHPTESIPRQAHLTKLHIVHPEAALIRTVLEEIGRSRSVEVDQGAAGLWAEIHTPRGTVRL